MSARTRWLGTMLTACAGVSGALAGGEPLASEASFAALSVADRDRMVEWYVEHLGFTVESAGDNDQRRGALLVRPGMMLEIAQFKEASLRQWQTHQVHGIFKLGFQVVDIDAALDSFLENGIEPIFGPAEASGGRRTFAVADPEGNLIQFFSGAGPADPAEPPDD